LLSACVIFNSEVLSLSADLMNTATAPCAVERLDLENTTDTTQVFLHKQRYDFALERISRNDSVLEVGTGTGYFSSILADHCDSYTGLEIDPNSCEATRRRLGGRGKVIEADARALPFPNASFSSVVALEVLEHIQDYPQAVREIHRCIRPEGRLIVSVPYRKKGGKNPINPYHVHEPGEEELIQCLASHFGKVQVFYQYFSETSFMTAARVLHMRRFFGLAQIYGDLWNGVPAALQKIKIDSRGNGMRIGLLLVASERRKSGAA
jgi:ubiquinone/menaquinone biosynthesis C-methylase UbiE